MEAQFTLKLEATGSVIKDIIADGLRIAKQIGVIVETEINGVELHIHPLYTYDEVMEQYRVNAA